MWGLTSAFGFGLGLGGACKRLHLIREGVDLGFEYGYGLGLGVQASRVAPGKVRSSVRVTGDRLEGLHPASQSRVRVRATVRVRVRGPGFKVRT